MSNRKRSDARQWNKLFMYDENGKKILLGSFRINTELPEKSQIRQGVNGITELMNSYYISRICEEAEKIKAENEQLKAR